MSTVEPGKKRVAVENGGYTQTFDVVDLAELKIILQESMVDKVSLAHINPWDYRSFGEDKDVEHLTEKDFQVLTDDDISMVYHSLSITSFNWPSPRQDVADGVCAYCGGTKEGRHIGKIIRWHPQMGDVCWICKGRQV